MARGKGKGKRKNRRNDEDSFGSLPDTSQQAASQEQSEQQQWGGGQARRGFSGFSSGAFGVLGDDGIDDSLTSNPNASRDEITIPAGGGFTLPEARHEHPTIPEEQEEQEIDIPLNNGDEIDIPLNGASAGGGEMQSSGWQVRSHQTNSQSSHSSSTHSHVQMQQHSSSSQHSQHSFSGFKDMGSAQHSSSDWAQHGHGHHHHHPVDARQVELNMADQHMRASQLSIRTNNDEFVLVGGHPDGHHLPDDGRLSIRSACSHSRKSMDRDWMNGGGLPMTMTASHRELNMPSQPADDEIGNELDGHAGSKRYRVLSERGATSGGEWAKNEFEATGDQLMHVNMAVASDRGNVGGEVVIGSGHSGDHSEAQLPFAPATTKWRTGERLMKSSGSISQTSTSSRHQIDIPCEGEGDEAMDPKKLIPEIRIIAASDQQLNRSRPGSTIPSRTGSSASVRSGADENILSPRSRKRSRSQSQERDRSRSVSAFGARSDRSRSYHGSRASGMDVDPAQPQSQHGSNVSIPASIHGSHQSGFAQLPSHHGSHQSGFNKQPSHHGSHQSGFGKQPSHHGSHQSGFSQQQPSHHGSHHSGFAQPMSHHGSHQSGFAQQQPSHHGSNQSGFAQPMSHHGSHQSGFAKQPSHHGSHQSGFAQQPSQHGSHQSGFTQQPSHHGSHQSGFTHQPSHHGSHQSGFDQQPSHHDSHQSGFVKQPNHHGSHLSGFEEDAVPVSRHGSQSGFDQVSSHHGSHLSGIAEESGASNHGSRHSGFAQQPSQHGSRASIHSDAHNILSENEEELEQHRFTGERVAYHSSHAALSQNRQRSNVSQSSRSDVWVDGASSDAVKIFGAPSGGSSMFSSSITTGGWSTDGPRLTPGSRIPSRASDGLLSTADTLTDPDHHDRTDADTLSCKSRSRPASVFDETETECYQDMNARSRRESEMSGVRSRRASEHVELPVEGVRSRQPSIASLRGEAGMGSRQQSVHGDAGWNGQRSRRESEASHHNASNIGSAASLHTAAAAGSTEWGYALRSRRESEASHRSDVDEVDIPLNNAGSRPVSEHNFGLGGESRHSSRHSVNGFGTVDGLRSRRESEMSGFVPRSRHASEASHRSNVEEGEIDIPTNAPSHHASNASIHSGVVGVGFGSRQPSNADLAGMRSRQPSMQNIRSRRESEMSHVSNARESVSESNVGGWGESGARSRRESEMSHHSLAGDIEIPFNSGDRQMSTQNLYVKNRTASEIGLSGTSINGDEGPHGEFGAIGGVKTSGSKVVVYPAEEENCEDSMLDKSGERRCRKLSYGALGQAEQGFVQLDGDNKDSRGSRTSLQTAEQPSYHGSHQSGFVQQQPSGFGSQSTQSSGFGQKTAAFGSQSTQSSGFGQKAAEFGSQQSGFGQKSAGFGSQPSGFAEKSTAFGSQKSASGFGQTSTGFGSSRFAPLAPSHHSSMASVHSEKMGLQGLDEIEKEIEIEREMGSRTSVYSHKSAADDRAPSHHGSTRSGFGGFAQQPSHHGSHQSGFGQAPSHHAPHLSGLAQQPSRPVSQASGRAPSHHGSQPHVHFDAPSHHGSHVSVRSERSGVDGQSWHGSRASGLDRERERAASVCSSRHSLADEMDIPIGGRVSRSASKTSVYSAADLQEAAAQAGGSTLGLLDRVDSEPHNAFATGTRTASVLSLHSYRSLVVDEEEKDPNEAFYEEDTAVEKAAERGPSRISTGSVRTQSTQDSSVEGVTIQERISRPNSRNSVHSNRSTNQQKPDQEQKMEPEVVIGLPAQLYNAGSQWDMHGREYGRISGSNRHPSHVSLTSRDEKRSTSTEGTGRITLNPLSTKQPIREQMGPGVPHQGQQPVYGSRTSLLSEKSNGVADAAAWGTSTGETAFLSVPKPRSRSVSVNSVASHHSANQVASMQHTPLSARSSTNRMEAMEPMNQASRSRSASGHRDYSKVGFTYMPELHVFAKEGNKPMRPTHTHQKTPTQDPRGMSRTGSRTSVGGAERSVSEENNNSISVEISGGLTVPVPRSRTVSQASSIGKTFERSRSESVSRYASNTSIPPSMRGVMDARTPIAGTPRLRDLTAGEEMPFAHSPGFNRTQIEKSDFDARKRDPVACSTEQLTDVLHRSLIRADSVRFPADGFESSDKSRTMPPAPTHHNQNAPRSPTKTVQVPPPVFKSDERTVQFGKSSASNPNTLELDRFDGYKWSAQKSETKTHRTTSVMSTTTSTYSSQQQRFATKYTSSGNEPHTVPQPAKKMLQQPAQQKREWEGSPQKTTKIERRDPVGVVSQDARKPVELEIQIPSNQPYKQSQPQKQSQPPRYVSQVQKEISVPQMIDLDTISDKDRQWAHFGTNVSETHSEISLDKLKVSKENAAVFRERALAESRPSPVRIAAATATVDGHPRMSRREMEEEKRQYAAFGDISRGSGKSGLENSSFRSGHSMSGAQSPSIHRKWQVAPGYGKDKTEMDKVDATAREQKKWQGSTISEESSVYSNDPYGSKKKMKKVVSELRVMLNGENPFMDENVKLYELDSKAIPQRGHIRDLAARFEDMQNRVESEQLDERSHLSRPFGYNYEQPRTRGRSAPRSRVGDDEAAIMEREWRERNESKDDSFLDRSRRWSEFEDDVAEAQRRSRARLESDHGLLGWTSTTAAMPSRTTYGQYPQRVSVSEKETEKSVSDMVDARPHGVDTVPHSINNDPRRVPYGQMKPSNPVPAMSALHPAPRLNVANMLSGEESTSSTAMSKARTSTPKDSSRRRDTTTIASAFHRVPSIRVPPPAQPAPHPGQTTSHPAETGVLRPQPVTPVNRSRPVSRANSKERVFEERNEHVDKNGNRVTTHVEMKAGKDNDGYNYEEYREEREVRGGSGAADAEMEKRVQAQMDRMKEEMRELKANADYGMFGKSQIQYGGQSRSRASRSRRSANAQPNGLGAKNGDLTTDTEDDLVAKNGYARVRRVKGRGDASDVFMQPLPTQQPQPTQQHQPQQKAAAGGSAGDWSTPHRDAMTIQMERFLRHQHDEQDKFADKFTGEIDRMFEFVDNEDSMSARRSTLRSGYGGQDNAMLEEEEVVPEIDDDLAGYAMVGDKLPGAGGDTKERHERYSSLHSNTNMYRAQHERRESTASHRLSTQRLDGAGAAAPADARTLTADSRRSTASRKSGQETHHTGGAAPKLAYSTKNKEAETVASDADIDYTVTGVTEEKTEEEGPVIEKTNENKNYPAFKFKALSGSRRVRALKNKNEMSGYREMQSRRQQAMGTPSREKLVSGGGGVGETVVRESPAQKPRHHPPAPPANSPPNAHSPVSVTSSTGLPPRFSPQAFAAPPAGMPLTSYHGREDGPTVITKHKTATLQSQAHAGQRVPRGAPQAVATSTPQGTAERGGPPRAPEWDEDDSFVSTITTASDVLARQDAETKRHLNKLAHQLGINEEQIHMTTKVLSLARKKQQALSELTAQRTLLLARERVAAIRLEMQRVRALAAVRRPPPPVARDMRSTMQVSNMTVFLNRNFCVRTVEQQTMDAAYSFVIVLKCGVEVEATAPVTLMDSRHTRVRQLHFAEHVRFGNLPVDFAVHLEVYAMKLRDPKQPEPSCGSNIAARARNLLTPSSLARHRAERTALQEAMTGGEFVKCGSVTLNRDTTGKQKFYLDNAEYPLEGTIEITSRCTTLPPAVELDFRGFLTMYQVVGGFGSWVRFWSVLRRGLVHFWRYPDDEMLEKAPVAVMDLSKCVDSMINHAPQEVCSRPHSFCVDMLVSTTPTLVEKKRVLLSSDSKELCAAWMQALNETLGVIRASPIE